MKVSVSKRSFDVEVNLPGSKSESNRALMICYYGGFSPEIQCLSHADDTVLLQKVLSGLKCGTSVIDCGNAGSVCRFVLTALAMRDTDTLLTGSERMFKRPIGGLVKVLRSLGADISYCKSEGFLPLSVRGGTLRGGEVSVDVSESSQFVSSIMLAAPMLNGGLKIHLEGLISSLPYIDMTAEVMRRYGAKVERVGREVVVHGESYTNCRYSVEPDWSAASYWFEAVALSRGGRALLKNLDTGTSQGDSVLTDIFSAFGVSSRMCEGGLLIENNSAPLDAVFRFDFSDNPDLFPAVAVTCAGLQVEAVFEGLRNLSIKESDRVTVMMEELSKIGVEMERCSADRLIIKPLSSLPYFTDERAVVFDSHDDHRIAMALAPLSLKIGSVEITNAEAVSKSYPDYFDELSKLV